MKFSGHLLLLTNHVMAQTTESEWMDNLFGGSESATENLPAQIATSYYFN